VYVFRDTFNVYMDLGPNVKALDISYVVEGMIKGVDQDMK
jgi:hypothetical protein